MNHQDFISRPGFVYRIGNQYYYLGKWICQKCSDSDAADSHYMYELAYKEQNPADLNLYFQKLLAYSDFALTPPLDKEGVHRAQDLLLESLSDIQAEDLTHQIHVFEECCSRFLNL